MINLFPEKLSEVYDSNLDSIAGKNILWISDLVVCSIKAYLRSRYPKFEKPNAFSLAGQYIHKIIQTEMLNSDSNWKAEVPVEKEIKDGWKIKGKADLVKDVVVEIKTYNASRNPELEKIDRWIIQTNFYAKTLGIDKFEIWIVKIDSGRIRKIPYFTNDKLYENTIKIAEDCLNGMFNILPLNRSSCRNCVYKDDICKPRWLHGTR